MATRFALPENESPSLHWREGETDHGERFVIVASEPLSDENGWQAVENGRMLTVDPGLEAEQTWLAANRGGHPTALSDGQVPTSIR